MKANSKWTVRLLAIGGSGELNELLFKEKKSKTAYVVSMVVSHEPKNLVVKRV